LETLEVYLTFLSRFGAQSTVHNPCWLTYLDIEKLILERLWIAEEEDLVFNLSAFSQLKEMIADILSNSPLR
jgi:hypothetical protein